MDYSLYICSPKTIIYHIMLYKRIIIIALLLSFVANLSVGGNVKRKQLIDNGWVFNDKQTVCLPHDWSARMAIDRDAPAGNDGGYYPTGVGIYNKVLNLTKDYEGKKLWLFFEGVYQDSEVRVNGKVAGGHPYGYSSFWCDITELVKTGKNDITVKADNSKQKNCRWYSGSGIYRHVWLVATEPVHIDNWGMFITTPDMNTVVVETDVKNETYEPRKIEVRTELSDGTNGSQTVTVEANASVRVKETLHVANPRLWSPSCPNLYTAKVSLSSGDTMTETFGIRTIEYSAEKGFLLNGEPMLLNGGCVHHDNGILGAAAFDKAEIRKVRLMKDAGYNAVRTAHNPPSEAFLNACDSIGLLVIDEALDGWREAKNGEDYHKLFDSWYAKDIEALVRRDRNHPSVFCWSIGNEVTLQISLKEKFFIGIFCIQVGTEKVIQLVCLQLFGCIEQHFTGKGTACGYFLQFLHKAGLTAHGKIGILNNLLVNQIQFVHGSFFTQREVGNHHVIRMSQIKNGIQKMGFPFAVFAADNHARGFTMVTDLVKTVRNFFHDLWACFRKILSNSSRWDSGTQCFYNMSCFKIIHLCLPPAWQVE